MTEGNWDVSGVDAEFVDVPLGGVWTAPDGARRRVDGKPVGFPSLFVVRAAAPKTFRKAERRNLKSQI